MRQPVVGKNGATWAATGETTPESRLHAAFPQTSEVSPPTTVARNTPRPMRAVWSWSSGSTRGSSGIDRSLHVCHACEKHAPQVAGMVLRVHPYVIAARMRIDQPQRLLRDGAAPLRRVVHADPCYLHAVCVANRCLREPGRADLERPAHPSLVRRLLEVHDPVLAHPRKSGRQPRVHRACERSAAAEGKQHA